MKGTRLALVTGRTGETTPKQGRGEPAQPAQSAGSATTKHTNLATNLVKKKRRPIKGEDGRFVAHPEPEILATGRDWARHCENEAIRSERRFTMVEGGGA